MPVNLSVKNVPEALAQRLRERAARNHRSLQGELMAILEEASSEPGPLSPAAVLAQVRALGMATPATSVGLVRQDRDEGDLA